MRNVGVSTLVAAALLLAVFVAVVPAEAEVPTPTEFFGGEKDWTLWSAAVTGSVFCDQCLQGTVFPFCHAMDGAKVLVQCRDASGNVVDSSEASTNFFGDFLVTFRGKEDLSGCSVSVAGSPDGNCNIVGGGGKTMTLKSKFLFSALYVVDPLFYKPAQPMGFCPKSGPFPVPSHGIPAPSHGIPAPSNGPITVPFPSRHPSTCSYVDWLHIEYYCYWPKDLSPLQTTVGSVFGKGAEQKYGNKSLVGGLLSGDELLRQSIASLLNSRTNRHFYLSSRGIMHKFYKAMYASPSAQTAQAQAFQAANNGFGKGKCLLVPCKL